MVETAQGFGVPLGIEETPNPIGRPYGGRYALSPEFGIEEDPPRPASAGLDYLMSMLENEVERDLFLEFDHAGRIHMTDTDFLNYPLSCLDEISLIENNFETLFMPGREIRRSLVMDIYLSWLRKTSFMAGGEIKSGRAAMRANGMSLTMPPTPITGGSSANSTEDLNLYLDSGASRNMVFNSALLSNPRAPPAGTYQFMAADGSPMAVIGFGDIEMENFRIPDVYLVEGLTVNLISVGQLASSHKVCCCFAGNECNLMLSDWKRVGGAIRREDNQYLLRFLEIE